MRKYRKFIVLGVAVGVILIAGMLGFVAQQNRKNAELQAQVKALHEQMEKDKQQESAASQEVSEAEKNKTAREACMAEVNRITTEALESPELKNATEQSRATATQGILQIQQTGITQCQSRYP